MESTTTHYHWSTPWQDGMGDVDNGTYVDRAELYHALADWLEQIAEHRHERAYTLAENGDHEEGWNELRASDRIGIAATNLRTVAQMMDGTRDPAPFYASVQVDTRRDMLVDHAEQILSDVDAGQDTPHYWECDEPERCELASHEKARA